MRIKPWPAVALCLSLPALASAEYFICGTETQFRRQVYADLTQMTDATCSLVPEADIATQELLRTTVAYRYLKVVGAPPTEGRLTEKTQGEKDAVDAALVAVDALRQSYLNEVANDNFCTLTNLAAITTRMETEFDALQTDVDAITVIDTVNTTKTALTNILAAEKILFRKIARCLVARSKIRCAYAHW